MSEIFKCNCGCGGVEIATIDFGDGEVVFVEFLKRCRAGRSFRKRFEMSWRLLRWVDYYDDDIVLTKSTAGALGSALVELSYTMESE